MNGTEDADSLQRTIYKTWNFCAHQFTRVVRISNETTKIRCMNCLKTLELKRTYLKNTETHEMVMPKIVLRFEMRKKQIYFAAAPLLFSASNRIFAKLFHEIVRFKLFNISLTAIYFPKARRYNNLQNSCHALIQFWDKNNTWFFM